MSFPTPALNDRYRLHSGHRSALALNGSVANDPQLTSMLLVKTACYAVFTFHQSPCSPAGHIREVGTDKGFEAFCGGRQFGVPDPQHRDNVPDVPPRKVKRGQGFGS